jgi:hypothetical protein
VTGVVAFLMCIQAKQMLLSFVPGTFIGACATFAGQGDWKLVVPSLAWVAVWLCHEEQRSMAGSPTRKSAKHHGGE